MKTMTPHPPHPKFSSRWPHEDLTTPAEVDVERRLDSLRARHPGARIEIARIEHDLACNSNDGRRCDCQPIPVAILDGRRWVRLLTDRTEQPVDQAAPHPAWLDEEGGHLLLAETMPLAEWLRLEFCQVVCVIIGDGAEARFHGEPINPELTRALHRVEAQIQPK